MTLCKSIQDSVAPGVSWPFGNSTLTLSTLCRLLSQESSDVEYISKYRQLEAQELDLCGDDQPTSGPGKRVSLNVIKRVPEVFLR